MYRIPGTGVGVTSGGVGTLAATGADPAWWLTTGLVLLALGIFAIVAARRRTQRFAKSGD